MANHSLGEYVATDTIIHLIDIHTAISTDIPSPINYHRIVYTDVCVCVCVYDGFMIV